MSRATGSLRWLRISVIVVLFPIVQTCVSEESDRARMSPVAGVECGVFTFGSGTDRVRVSTQGVVVDWSPDWSSECGWVSYDTYRESPDVFSSSGRTRVWLGEGDDAGWVESDVATWDWSPDGAWIAQVGGGSSSGVLTAWRSGEEPRGKWVTGSVGSRQWAWSPDSSGIAYLTKSSKLWLWSIDGEEGRKIADDVERWRWDWSPDGSRLGYRVGRDLHIWSVDRETPDLLSDDVGKWDWSPDGTMIAHSDGVEDYYGEGDLRIRRVDGGDVRLLATGVGKWGWSPDSRRIAYTTGVGRRDLWVSSIDGEVTRWLAGDVGDDGTAWSWSHDGLRIAYSDGEYFNGRLRVLSVDGSEVDRIATIAGSWHWGGWDWAPRGRRIAYRSNAELFVWSDDHGVSKRVAGSTYGFRWSPDGSLIAFSGDDGTFVVDVARLFESQGGLE